MFQNEIFILSLLYLVIIVVIFSGLALAIKLMGPPNSWKKKT